MISQNGCARVSYKNSPPFPLAGPAVADELLENCPQNKCPAVWEWVHRLSILHDQLGV